MGNKADCPKCNTKNSIRVLQFREFPSIRSIVDGFVGPEIGVGDEEIVEEYAECEECYIKYEVNGVLVDLTKEYISETH